MKLVAKQINNIVEVIFCIKQFTSDDYFITVEVVYCGTQPTFVFVMQQYFHYKLCFH